MGRLLLRPIPDEQLGASRTESGPHLVLGGHVEVGVFAYKCHHVLVRQVRGFVSAPLVRRDGALLYSQLVRKLFLSQAMVEAEGLEE
jgi:hypothetical protein